MIENTTWNGQVKPVNPKGNQPWIFTGRTEAEAEASVLSHLMRRADSLEKTLMLGKIEGRRRKGQQRMVRWHHQLNGHEFEQTQGDSGELGSLACYSPWGHKESDTTIALTTTSSKTLKTIYSSVFFFFLFLCCFKVFKAKWHIVF